MKTIKYNQLTRIAVIGIAATLFISAMPVYAGIGGDHDRNKHPSRHENAGNVLSAKAEPKGYSLTDMAEATAAFNESDHSAAFPDVVNGKPFQGLYTTLTNEFDVDENTILYVPVMFNDDSQPVIGHYPKVGDQKALEKYFNSSKELGAQYANITVDGKTTSLNHDYLVNVKVALPDGANQYMTVAAFLSPLKKGKHSVIISFLADGKALCEVIGGCPPPFQFSIEYTVNVK